jgi:hypothetical protein
MSIFRVIALDNAKLMALYNWYDVVSRENYEARKNLRLQEAWIKVAPSLSNTVVFILPTTH